GRNGQAGQRLLVGLNATQFLSGSRLPEADRAVAAACEQGLAVAREGNYDHTLAVSLEPALLLPAGAVPEPHSAVGASRGESLALRPPRARSDRSLMSEG